MSTGQNDRRLTTTSYAILCQLALKPWSTYELARQRVRYFRYVWPKAESAIYREVKQLAAEGLVDGRREVTGKRGRTKYSITEAGLAELHAWLDTPPAPFAMEFEAMLRVFVAPVAEPRQVIAALEQVRADAGEMLRFAGEVKLEHLAGRGVLQGQLYVRALAMDFFVSLLRTVDGWAERSIVEIETWEDTPIEERNERALGIVAGLPVETPREPSVSAPVAPESQARSRRYSRTG